MGTNLGHLLVKSPCYFANEIGEVIILVIAGINTRIDVRNIFISPDSHLSTSAQTASRRVPGEIGVLASFDPLPQMLPPNLLICLHTAR